MAAGRILIVEDEHPLREMLKEFLSSLGHSVHDVSTLDLARARARARPFDLVLADVHLERGTGFDLLEEIRAEGLECEVVIMTGQGGIPEAIRAIRSGAFDFVTKPLDLPSLADTVTRALDAQEQGRRLDGDRETTGFGSVTTAGAASMKPVIRLLERASSCDSNVLLLGESGTGKEVAARSIHESSSRSAQPFVAVNCGAIPAELLESELFGHSRGSFTGAERSRTGLFVAADGGTIFLDEIGTASHSLQVRLLRVLQQRVVRPVGSEADIELDVRVIAATNADIDSEMADGRFRHDLFYRLATLVVELPPLRDRREDIPLLAKSLLQDIETRVGRTLKLSPRALERLAGYEWPGNVRELAHLLERSAVTAAKTSVLHEQDLAFPEMGGAADADAGVKTLEEVEREHIGHVLELCGGNKRKAAQLLGIPRPTLYRKIEKYGLAKTGANSGEQSQPNRPPDVRQSDVLKHPTP